MLPEAVISLPATDPRRLTAIEGVLASGCKRLHAAAPFQHPGHAVFTASARLKPSSSMETWRIRNFWIFPVTVVGNSVVNLT